MKHESEIEATKPKLVLGSLLYQATIQNMRGGDFPEYRLDLVPLEIIGGRYTARVKILPRSAPIDAEPIVLDRRTLEERGFDADQEGFRYFTNQATALRDLVGQLRDRNPDAEFTYSDRAHIHRPR